MGTSSGRRIFGCGIVMWGGGGVEAAEESSGQQIDNIWNDIGISCRESAESRYAVQAGRCNTETKMPMVGQHTRRCQRWANISEDANVGPTYTKMPMVGCQSWIQLCINHLISVVINFVY